MHDRKQHRPAGSEVMVIDKRMDSAEAAVAGIADGAYTNAPVKGAEVELFEVDPQTGGVTLLNYVIVNDCGRVINPMTAEGQLHGGVVHGIGNSLFEWMGYDNNAQPLTTNFADYLLPSAPEIPPIDVRLVEYPSTKNPLGVKGIGESGTVPAAPAMISGIEDALSSYGVRIDEAPISPARLFQLIQAASD